MKYYNTNELRSGLNIIFNGEPYSIIENEFVKPGKGQAFNRIRLRNLISEKIFETIFKSGDSSIEVADIIDITLTYLYNEGELWYFINNKTFDQLAVHIQIIGKNKFWLVEQTPCILTLWKGNPISVTLPNFVDIKIIETDPVFKKYTSVSGSKLATLITGTLVKVPLFIQVGDIIKIDTRSGEYVSRISREKYK